MFFPVSTEYVHESFGFHHVKMALHKLLYYMLFSLNNDFETEREIFCGEFKSLDLALKNWFSGRDSSNPGFDIVLLNSKPSLKLKIHK